MEGGVAEGNGKTARPMVHGRGLPRIFAAIMRITSRSFLLAGAWMLSGVVFSQDQPTAKFSLEKGLVLQKDSVAKLAFGVRVQNRVSYLHQEAPFTGDDVLEFRIRRLRMTMAGFLLNPRLEYKLQFGFARQDMDLGDGVSGPNPIMDAVILYRVAPQTRIGFGQMRMAGGRQILNSDALWETPDRSVAVSAHSLDRDIGIHVLQGIDLGRQRVNIRGAISQGEGRAPSEGNSGLCYTARMDWLPLGPFKENGEYSEGDLLHEETPKLALGLVYSSDRKARRTRAQLGRLMPDGSSRTINTFFADAHLKYRGWSWLNEFSSRSTPERAVVPGLEGWTTVAVNNGWGFTSELGRMLGERSQVVAMYSIIRHDRDADLYYLDLNEGLVGYNYFFHGHQVKVQGAASYIRPVRDRWIYEGRRYGTWGVVLQLQWGIG